MSFEVVVIHFGNCLAEELRATVFV